MSVQTGRRRFLENAVWGGAVLGLGRIGLFGQLPSVSADEAVVDRNLVRFDSGIEPLVRLLEEAPQNGLLEAVATKVRGGTSYREILAALLLAGVRNVQPRPSVGFKFHAVLVVNSAHLASLSAPDSDRWLPIFWALDYFKSQQLKEESASGWKKAPDTPCMNNTGTNTSMTISEAKTTEERTSSEARRTTSKTGRGVSAA